MNNGTNSGSNNNENIPVAQTVTSAQHRVGAVFKTNGNTERVKALKEESKSRSAFQMMFIDLGTANMKGPFVVPRKITYVFICGGAEVDMSNAIFVHPVTEVQVFSVCGGCNITLPLGVRYESSGVAICAGFDSHDEEAHGADPNAPLVRVTGVLFMSGTKVQRNFNNPPIQIDNT